MKQIYKFANSSMNLANSVNFSCGAIYQCGCEDWLGENKKNEFSLHKSVRECRRHHKPQEYPPGRYWITILLNSYILDKEKNLSLRWHTFKLTVRFKLNLTSSPVKRAYFITFNRRFQKFGKLWRLSFKKILKPRSVMQLKAFEELVPW